MRKKKYVLSIAGAMLAIAVVASVAMATVFTSGKIYGGVFTGTQGGNQQFTVPNTSGGSLLVNCTSAQYTGKVQPVSGQPSVTFQPSYTSCQTNIGGVRAATVSTPAAWKLSVSAYDDTNGQSGQGWVTTAGPVVISPNGLTCKVTVANQTISNGITGQDTLNGANATHTTANGVSITATNASPTYTSNCVGVSASGFGTYNGVVNVAGAWAGP
jgi:hypothetical protein